MTLHLASNAYKTWQQKKKDKLEIPQNSKCFHLKTLSIQLKDNIDRITENKQNDFFPSRHSTLNTQHKITL
jgi:hypothetical protein